eukprot:TRINITY_DN5291_c0_g1_i2.p1 TRINITY_DN5291_c0_g1~~TRINITY_DN5291_c0_g1_i2.p1  ORF type:complete len:259 (+),score=76.79 TRINITY_DN5291_c0_g1_i2:220-996(+)
MAVACAGAGGFEVTVRLMDDLVPDRITPLVHRDEKIGILVERIQKLAQVQEVTLQYRNEVLQHHCTIGDYGIDRESTVYGFPSVNPHPNCRFCLACRKRLMKKKLEMRKQVKTVEPEEEDEEGSGVLASCGQAPLIVDSEGKVQGSVQEAKPCKAKGGNKNSTSPSGESESSRERMSAAERVAAFEASGGFSAIFDQVEEDEEEGGPGEMVSFENLLEQMKLEEEEAGKAPALTPAQKKRNRKKKAKLRKGEVGEELE